MGKKFSLKREYRPEYAALTNAKHRCHNPDHYAYHNYGGRGIRVCDEWLSDVGFYLFLDHIGPRPSANHSLDRINNDGHYEPGNVRWEVRTVQQNNRRPSRRKVGDLGWGIGFTAKKGSGQGQGRSRSPLVPYKGGLWTLAEACADAGYNRFTVRQRIRRGMSPADAFSLPVGCTGEKRKAREVISGLIKPSNDNGK